MQQYSQKDETICALATPFAESALAVIRISGENSHSIFRTVFSMKKAFSEAEGNTIVYGRILDPAVPDCVIDEVMAAKYNAPKSYTGEDMVEVFCHGSLPGIQKIIELLLGNGARQALPGEFTFRAFMNGKLDLTRAEAVQEIVSSKTRFSQRLAADRLTGSVEKEIDRVKSMVLDILASIELTLDYPEDEVEDVVISPESLEAAAEHAERVSNTYNAGRLYQEGIQAALVGPTNAGKSSIFNMLVREDRAIVSEVHGTTRDYLETWITIQGLPVKVFDTAGIRRTGNKIEAAGIQRSRQIIEKSDILVFIVDGTEGLTLEAESELSGMPEGKQVIKLWNKADSENLLSVPEGYLAFSAVTGEGFEDLEDAIVSLVPDTGSILEGAAVIDSQRQKALLDEAAESLRAAAEAVESGQSNDLVALDVQEALTCLGEITGEVTSSEVLFHMFSNFCVGK
ncbi:MAG: tRNA uridine-5-carboxymethylaminomethyl(34) synthesis GTPase MnmE [Spirochaetia bacterium]